MDSFGKYLRNKKASALHNATFHFPKIFIIPVWRDNECERPDLWLIIFIFLQQHIIKMCHNAGVFNQKRESPIYCGVSKIVLNILCHDCGSEDSLLSFWINCYGFINDSKRFISRKKDVNV